VRVQLKDWPEKPPSKVATYRCSFTLPRELARQINFVAKCTGVTQSALLSMILEAPLADMAKLFELLPADGKSPGPDTQRRLTEDSAAALRSRVNEVLEMARAIDPQFKLTDD
jgi:hypothetical protein